MLVDSAYGTFTIVVVMSLYTPPSMLTKLNTFFMILLILSKKADSWLLMLMYSLMVSLFHRPIFWISLSE